MDNHLNIRRETLLFGRQNNQAWFAPTACQKPVEGNGPPLILVSAVLLLANDCGPVLVSESFDGGESWRPPMLSQSLHKRPRSDGSYETFVPGLFHHRKSSRILGIGSTLYTRDSGVHPMLKGEMLLHQRRDRHNAWCLWDDRRHDFLPWQTLDHSEFGEEGEAWRLVSCSQIHERDDGVLLFPATREVGRSLKVATTLLRFDDGRLAMTDVGPAIESDDQLSVCEPSLVCFQGRYLMTMRSQAGDGRMYVAQSEDGVTWKNAREWTWDDGQDVQTMNTQQHWLTLNDALYLVYTRVNEQSNGVFRHRAPLFIARVEPDRLCLIRDSEQIVFPERGARMGNFAVLPNQPSEAWVITGEWLEQATSPAPKPPFLVDIEDQGDHYNRMQFVGDLLLARVTS